MLFLRGGSGGAGASCRLGAASCVGGVGRRGSPLSTTAKHLTQWVHNGQIQGHGCWQRNDAVPLLDRRRPPPLVVPWLLLNDASSGSSVSSGGGTASGTERSAGAAEAGAGTAAGSGGPAVTGAAADGDRATGGPEPPVGDQQPALANAKKAWESAINATDSGEAMPKLYNSIGDLWSWFHRKVALRHAKECAPQARQDGLFDSLEDDVQEGGNLCLQFLVDSLGNGEGGADGRPGLRLSALKPPYLDEALGERITEMVAALQEAQCSWRWELEGEAEAHLDRMFLIAPASRSGASRADTSNILLILGQQLCLSLEQARQFMTGGLRGRMAIMQEILVSDMVLVADVSVTVTQRSGLVCPGASDTSSAGPLELGPPATVRHVLRLEMAFAQDRNLQDEGVPHKRASAWQVVDWNWLCQGNHPMLKRGERSPW